MSRRPFSVYQPVPGIWHVTLHGEVIAQAYSHSEAWGVLDTIRRNAQP